MFTSESAKDLITELVDSVWRFIRSTPHESNEDMHRMALALTTGAPCWHSIEFNGRESFSTVNYDDVFLNIACRLFGFNYFDRVRPYADYVRDYLVGRGVCCVFDHPDFVSDGNDYAVFDKSFFDAIGAEV